MSEDVLVAMIGEVLLVFRRQRQWMLLNILQSVPHNKESNANSVKDEKPHSSRNMNVLKCSGSMD